MYYVDIDEPKERCRRSTKSIKVTEFKYTRKTGKNKIIYIPYKHDTKLQFLTYR
jgi:hypothetical protein